jgi:hypothetical protein
MPTANMEPGRRKKITQVAVLGIFYGSVIEDSGLLGYDSASLSELFATFRRDHPTFIFNA